MCMKGEGNVTTTGEKGEGVRGSARREKSDVALMCKVRMYHFTLTTTSSLSDRMLMIPSRVKGVITIPSSSISAPPEPSISSPHSLSPFIKYSFYTNITH